MNCQQRDVSRLLEQNDAILDRLQDRRRRIEAEIAKHLAVKRELEALIEPAYCDNGVQQNVKRDQCYGTE